MTEPGEQQHDRTAGGYADPRPQGLRVLGAEQFSVAEALGGVRGVVDSALPGVVFVVGYIATRDLVPALVASLAAMLVAVVVRLVQRTPPTQALSGVVGIAVGAVWAWRSGEAQNFYTWGLIINAVWGLGALLSVVAGWPAVGVLVSLLRGQDMSWRRAATSAAAHLRRRYAWATWLWVGIFGARLAVQVPMWLRGEESVGWLGTARLAMGVPLFALGIWLTWLLVASPGARAEQEDLPQHR